MYERVYKSTKADARISASRDLLKSKSSPCLQIRNSVANSEGDVNRLRVVPVSNNYEAYLKFIDFNFEYEFIKHGYEFHDAFSMGTAREARCDIIVYQLFKVPRGLSLMRRDTAHHHH
jgi:hypothetical protein